MKLLVVGHTYLNPFAQKKYEAMKFLSPELRIGLVVPRRMAHVFTTYRPRRSEGFSEGEYHVVRSFLERTNMTYFLDPFSFGTLLRKFKPDRIHIEEDPHSLIGAETVFLARMLCPRARLSFFIWDNLNRSPRFPFGPIKRFLTRYGFSRSDLVISGNREGERLLREAKGFRGRTCVVPQIGLDPADYEGEAPREILSRWKGGDSAPLIGFFGRLVPEKGLVDLMEALSGINGVPWKMVVVGAGPLSRELETKWKPLFGDRLRLEPPVSHREIPGLMKVLDIFVLPSYGTPRWIEQFGLTLAQAMMAGVPCVGSSSGAIPDVMGPGGVVFRERNVAELREALRSLLVSPSERARLGREGRDFALRNYTHRAVAAATLKAFGADS